VLANGTITKASKTQNPDLHCALQSGGNAFGIVTKFTLRTFPIGKVWGGTRFYAKDKTPKLLAAVRDFTQYYPDPKAAIIATAEATAYGAAQLWVIFFFYDGPSPPEHVFQNFTRIAHLNSDTKMQSYSKLLYGNNNYVLNGSYYSVTSTVPLEEDPVANFTVTRLQPKHCLSLPSKTELKSWTPSMATGKRPVNPLSIIFSAASVQSLTSQSQH
jgi:hypothetical protein